MARPRLQFLSFVAGMRVVERRDALAAFLTLMGFMAGHALLETARDALFLSRLPASQLPWVYLAIAAAALVLAEIQQRFPTGGSRPRELGFWLILCAAVTAGFWLLAGPGAGVWVYYALYTWSGMVATLVAVRFWTLLGQVFTVTQAKRLFAFIGSGSVLGAILGSGLARALTEVGGARHIVAWAAGAFLITSLAPALLERRREPEPRPGGAPPQGWPLRRVVRHIWARPYLVRIALLALVSTVTFTLIDFVFKSVVDRSVPPEELAGFFSSIYLGLNVLSLVVQLLVVSRLVRSFGVNVAQACVPAFLLIGTLGFLAGGVLTMALLLKGLDGGLRHSLHRTTTELLFFPISDRIRRPVKAVIDVFGQRGGQALGSMLILLVLTLTTREFVFAGIATLAAGVWLWATLDLRSHYVELFRQNLEEDITPTQLEFPALDAASLETLVRTLNDPDDRRVLAAMDLLRQQGRAGMIPPLILYHPCSEVVLRALGLLAQTGRKDFLSPSERLLSHPDPRVRAATLLVQTRTDPRRDRLESALEDGSPMVQATATVGLAANRHLGARAAKPALERFIREGDTATCLALAEAIRQQPSRIFEATLLQLGDRDETEIRLQVIRAMGEVRTPRFLAYLVRALGNRPLRGASSEALVAHGSRALFHLQKSVRDESLPGTVRRHLPAAIASFEAEEAARILLTALKTEKDGLVHFKLLRALGRLRTHLPALSLDATTLQEVIETTQQRASGYLGWRHALAAGAREDPSRRTAVHGMLVEILRDKQRHALERLFRLLNLLYGDEDFQNIHRGLQSSSRELRAGGRELVEHLVESPLRARLLRLIDDLYEPGGEDGTPGPDRVDYGDLLARLLGSGSESLSSLAARHAAELGLSHLLKTLKGLGSGLSPHHRRVLQRSIASLRG